MRPPNISNLRYHAKKHLIKAIKSPFKCFWHHIINKLQCTKQLPTYTLQCKIDVINTLLPTKKLQLG